MAFGASGALALLFFQALKIEAGEMPQFEFNLILVNDVFHYDLVF